MGTSGRSLDWFIQDFGLKAVELNASFYRLSSPSQVMSWARKGKRPRWAVKVHRSINSCEKALEAEAQRRVHIAPYAPPRTGRGQERGLIQLLGD